MISVVIPVYNGARFLDACLRSVTVDQTWRDLEVILVNDGSTDDSLQICQRHAALDPRIAVIDQPKQGPAAARNAGIERSRGEYLFFLDVDDSLAADALQRLVDRAREHDAQLTIGDFRKLGQANADSGHRAFFGQDSHLLTRDAIVDYAARYARAPYVYVLFVHCWGKLYDARIVREHGLRFNTALHNFEDVSFNFGYLAHADRVFFVNRVLYNYLVQPVSQSFRIGDGDHPRRYREAFAPVESFLRAHGRDDATELARHLYISCIIIMLIRSCGQSRAENAADVLRMVRDTVNSRDVREALPSYRPSGRDSRVLPILMRLRLARAIVSVCRFKYARHRRFVPAASSSTLASRQAAEPQTI